MKTMTLNLGDKEMAVLEDLASDAGMSKTAVMRQALRLYQASAHYAKKHGAQTVFLLPDGRRVEALLPMLAELNKTASNGEGV